MSNSHFFNFVEGPIGSGKTTALLEYLRNNPLSTTIATQTNDLSDQYETADGLAIEMICRVVGEDGDYTAASKIYRERLKNNHSGLYAVNQKVALDCQDAALGRHYFFDEIPSIFETFKFNKLPLTQDFVAGWLAMAWTDEPSYYELQPTPQIRNIAASAWQDDILKDCEEIITVAQRIASEHYRVFVKASAFNAFKNGIPKQIQFFAVARPSLFPKNTTFIGANFHHSLLYKIWSVAEDVDFEEHPEIRTKRRDLAHKADTTTIRYVSERDFSKRLFDEKLMGVKSTSKPTTFPKIAKATGKIIAEAYPSEQFIYCTNTVNERVKWAGVNGKLISSNSRGWNGARDINMAVFMAAINFDPATFTFLKKMYGLDKQSVKYALTYETAYQFAGRTSLRQEGSNRPVTLIFGDRSTAQAMASFIPGCAEPTLLDIGISALLFDELAEEDQAPKTA